MSLWSVLGGVVGGVLGGPAGASIGAGLGGAVDSKKATGNAVDAQVQSAKDANAAALAAQREAQAFQQKQVDQARADSADWLTAGRGAVNQLAQRTGVGGDLTGASSAFSKPFNFQADPGYAFRQAEGQKAVTNSAAARGGLLSGAAAKALQQRGQDIGSAEYGNAYSRYQTDNTNQFNRDQTTQTNQFNRLASLAGVGQTAANQNASAGMQLGGNVGAGMMTTAQTVGNNLTGAGNARASGYLANGNALAGAVNQGLSAWNQYNKPPVVGGTAPGPAGTYFDGYGYMANGG